MTKVHWMKQSRQENIAYLVVWGLLFAAPLLSLYVRTISDSNVTFDWAEVFLVWRKFAIYLVLFSSITSCWRRCWCISTAGWRISPSWQWSLWLLWFISVTAGLMTGSL